MARACRILRSAAPWFLIGAVVLAMLLKFTDRSPAEVVIIAALSVSLGLLVDSLATQFRTHVLGTWDRGS